MSPDGASPVRPLPYYSLGVIPQMNASMAGTPAMAQMGSAMKIGQIVGAIVTWVLSSTVPVFVLIFLNRPDAKAAFARGISDVPASA